MWQDDQKCGAFKDIIGKQYLRNNGACDGYNNI